MNAAARLLMSFFPLEDMKFASPLPKPVKRRHRLNLDSYCRRRLVGAKGMRP